MGYGTYIIDGEALPWVGTTVLAANHATDQYVQSLVLTTFQTQPMLWLMQTDETNYGTSTDPCFTGDLTLTPFTWNSSTSTWHQTGYYFTAEGFGHGGDFGIVPGPAGSLGTLWVGADVDNSSGASQAVTSVTLIAPSGSSGELDAGTLYQPFGEDTSNYACAIGYSASGTAFLGVRAVCGGSPFYAIYYLSQASVGDFSPVFGFNEEPYMQVTTGGITYPLTREGFCFSGHYLYIAAHISDADMMGSDRDVYLYAIDMANPSQNTHTTCMGPYKAMSGPFVAGSGEPEGIDYVYVDKDGLDYNCLLWSRLDDSLKYSASLFYLEAGQ